MGEEGIRFGVCQAIVGVKAGCLVTAFILEEKESWLGEEGRLWERRAEKEKFLRSPATRTKRKRTFAIEGQFESKEG